MSTLDNDDFIAVNVSRRTLLKGFGLAGTLVIAANWGIRSAFAGDEKAYGADSMPNGWSDDPKVFVSLQSDGSVSIFCNRSEMGQGIRTSLAMVVADEMEVDWAKVTVVQAPGDEAKYGNQNTDGSRSMRHWFAPMRRCGAAAKLMLVQAAAQQWSVKPAECSAELGVVKHKGSGRTLSYGELAQAAAKLAVPARDSLQLKSPEQFRYIGKQHTRAADGADIVTGKAVYGIDARFDDMVYVVVARPPVYGASLKRFDAQATLKVPGVLDVMKIDSTPIPSAFQPLGGVAVMATNTWAAMKGRDALVLEWDEGVNASYDSHAYKETLLAAARKPGKVVRNEGDVAPVFASAKSRITADYYLPHLAQAPMEPPVSTVLFKDGKCEVWAPVQNPQATRQTVADKLGIAFDNVTVNVTLLGGGFGRKAKPDFVLEAAIVAKTLPGRAVRVQWTRDDDIHFSYFHTVSVEHLEAVLGENGMPSAWLHRSVAPSIASLFGPDSGHESESELALGLVPVPLDVANVRIENPEAFAHTRIGWFRSVSNIPHAFAVQCFAAELAVAAKVDQKDYLLRLIGPARKIDPRTLGDAWNYSESPELYPVDTGRLRTVIETVAKHSNWGKSLPKGRAQGIAAHQSFASYTAVVLEVEVSANGTITVHDAVMAIDCGQQVNPDRIRSQMEGACVMGIGIAALGEISFKQGRVQQDNFHNYEVPRMPLAPKQISVHLIDPAPNHAIGGVGEPGLPPIAPALCNAIFNATGKRIRELPIRLQLNDWNTQA